MMDAAELDSIKEISGGLQHQIHIWLGALSLPNGICVIKDFKRCNVVWFKLETLCIIR